MRVFNQKWIRISIFYSIAVSIMGYFRIFSPDWYQEFHLPFGLSGLKDLFEGIGPFFGAFIVSVVFKPERRNSIFGTSRRGSLFVAIVPVLLFTLLGAENSEDVNVHLYGLFLGVLITFYCLLEETGWRGYLQDELRDINPVLKYLIIGSLWYAWHLTFLRSPVNIKGELIILTILILASAGIGAAVEYTHSVLVAACFHSLGNIIAFSSLIKKSVTFHHRLIIVGVCIFVWILALSFWERDFLKSEKSRTE